MGDDYSSGMLHVQQGGSSSSFPSGSAAWEGAIFQETMRANQAVLDASAAARTSQSFGYVGGGGGRAIHLRFVSFVEWVVLVVGGSLAVGNLLWSIHPVLGLLGIFGTGYAIVNVGGRLLRSRYARPVVTLLSVLVWGLGGLVIAALLWPHDFVWKIVFLCGGVAMAYFDKRALFRGGMPEL
jgi:hypothetical protein